MIVSMSGETYRPWKIAVIARVTDDRQLGRIDLGRQAFDNLAPPVPPVRTTIIKTSPGIDEVLERWSVGNLPSGPLFFTKPSVPQSCST